MYQHSREYGQKGKGKCVLSENKFVCKEPRAIASAEMPLRTFPIIQSGDSNFSNRFCGVCLLVEILCYRTDIRAETWNHFRSNRIGSKGHIGKNRRKRFEMNPIVGEFDLYFRRIENP